MCCSCCNAKKAIRLPKALPLLTHYTHTLPVWLLFIILCLPLCRFCFHVGLRGLGTRVSVGTATDVTDAAQVGLAVGAGAGAGAEEEEDIDVDTAKHMTSCWTRVPRTVMITVNALFLVHNLPTTNCTTHSLTHLRPPASCSCLPAFSLV